MRKTYKNHLIITLESFGCFTEIDGEYKIIPSIKVNPVDSTGAGDIFHGALTYFIIHNYPIEEALRLSNITGALSVKKIGSRYSISDLEEVINYREEK
jgi:sulfofructose kinase